MLVPMQGVESVAMGIYVRCGSRDETVENNGISHLLEHVVFRNKGTDKIESIGGLKNGGTYSEATMYEAKLPADRWKMGLQTISDMVINPHLLPQDIKKEQGIIFEEIKRKEDSPDEKVWELFLGFNTLGTAQVIKSLDSNKLRQYHQNGYLSNNIVVAMAGKIDIGLAKKEIKKIWGVLPKTDSQLRNKFEMGKTPKIFFKKHQGAEQIQLVLGGKGYTVSDSRRFPLAVLSKVLKFGLSGRLYKAVREKRGLVYAIDFDYNCEADYGYWGVDAGVSPKNLSELIQIILKELKLLTTTPLKDDELASAKEKCRVPLLFSMENPMRQMDFYGRQALDRPGEILTYSDAVNRIMSVTAEDVLKVARELFDPKNFKLAMVGPQDPKITW